MKQLKSFIREQLESWGLRSPLGRPTGLTVRVSAPLSDGTNQHVGDLSLEQGEYVFRYATSYRGATGAIELPGFPDLLEEYRSKVLFPFFATRLPPATRVDIQAALRRLNVTPSDTLRVLGTLAKRGLSNPYEFELAEA